MAGVQLFRALKIGMGSKAAVQAAVSFQNGSGWATTDLPSQTLEHPDVCVGSIVQWLGSRNGRRFVPEWFELDAPCPKLWPVSSAVGDQTHGVGIGRPRQSPDRDQAGHPTNLIAFRLQGATMASRRSAIRTMAAKAERTSSGGHPIGFICQKKSANRRSQACCNRELMGFGGLRSITPRYSVICFQGVGRCTKSVFQQQLCRGFGIGHKHHRTFW